MQGRNRWFGLAVFREQILDGELPIRDRPWISGRRVSGQIG
jgi:hypothetical protein